MSTKHEVCMPVLVVTKSPRFVFPPGEVLEISSDGDDQRIFWGLTFAIAGFFWVRKFGLGSLI